MHTDLTQRKTLATRGGIIQTLYQLYTQYTYMQYTPMPTNNKSSNIYFII